MLLDINGKTYEVEKRYVCSSLKHGAIESDFIDMTDATPCKEQTLKWTKELPTKEGYYWFKNQVGEYEIVEIEIAKDGKIWVWWFGTDDCQLAISEKHAKCSWIGEWYGPIEPPFHP